MPARLRDAWKLRKRLRGPGGPFRQAATLLRELMERSLRNRIVTSAMMVLTAAVIVLLMAISLVFMNLLLVQNITKSLAAQAAIHTHKIESALTRIADDIANLSSNMLLTSALVDSSGRDIYLDPFFKSYKVRDQLPITVALCDYLGNPLKTTGTDAEPLHLLPSVVEKVVESGTPHAEVLTAGSKTLLLMVYPVYFPSTKKPEGVVAAEVPLDDVFDKYLGSGKHDSQDIIRVAQAGTVIWSLMNRKAGKQFTATQSALLREPLHTLSLKITIGSYRKVPTLALAGVYTVAGACFLFLSFWIARIISVRVTSRLQALSKATKKIAESLAFEYIENTGEKDEVGTLTASFNRMTEVIIGMTQTLEKKVEERTAQLSEANTRLSREIAERKSTEEALREREGKIQAILRTTVDAIITITESNIIETFNPAAERIFGYSAGEVIGKNVKILMPEPDRSLHDEYVARYLRTGEKKLIGIGKELVGLRKDGEIFQMELAVSEVAIGDRRIFTGLIRDITERKKAEEALRKSEEQVRLLLESTAEAIYGIDLQGNCTFANPACIRMLGYGGPDALVGK
ncbi:MAG: PAS domain S-box protein, partial [Thermodesulfovibrionales bacterium]